MLKRIIMSSVNKREKPPTKTGYVGETHAGSLEIYIKN